MKIRSTVIIIALSLLGASCSTSKTALPYFTDIIEVPSGQLPAQDYLPTIQPNDELFITVNSKMPGATAQFNRPHINPAYSDELARNIAPRQQTYRVDSAGDIDFPLIGKIHVAGMNIEQLQAYLTGRISATVNDPIVNVALDTQLVTVAGEVHAPGRVDIHNRLTILEALASVGDLTEYGERTNVLIIREVDGQRQYAHLDLNDSAVLSSEYYYLKPNDYIYVAPNKVRQDNSKYNQNNAYKLSVISTIVSASSIIASLVIALTVK